jgi:hypothetical protein
MTEIATYAGQVEEYRPRIVMAADDAKALDDQLRAMQLAVLRRDTDYGVIPGMGDKPTLLKPGAEKLLQWFGFGFVNERDETERDETGQRIGVTYRCTVTKGLPDGHKVVVATCEGYAGYDEDRFYISAEAARAKAESKEKYNAAKYNRAPNKAKWEHATEYRAPWNTVIKMAQKRALVGAAIDATAAGGLFTQDLEDLPPSPADGNGQDRKADRSRGTPDDDPWYSSTTARPQDPTRPAAPAATSTGTGSSTAPAADGHSDTERPWADTAIERAASFKTEAEGQALWRESAAMARDGTITPGVATHIQNLVNARIYDRRKEASARLLGQLSETDEWRLKVEELGDEEEAHGALRELGELTAAGTVDGKRSGRISRAIIARYPKAALHDPEAAA